MIRNKAWGIFRLFRLDLSSAAGICIVAGEMLATEGHISLSEALLGFLVGFFISSSTLILNDYFDIESDTINAPARPLPSGNVRPYEAILLTIFTALAGLAFALSIGMVAFFVAILMWGVGFFYNYRLKETGLFGNIMVATSVAMTFIYGGIVVGETWNKIVWSFAVIVFLIDLGEEIAADAMDVKGDAQKGSKSVAIVKGTGEALRVASILFALVVAFSFVPLLLGWLGMNYVVFILPMDIVIIFSTVKMFSSETIDARRRYLRFIYIGATISLVAFIIGYLTI